MPRLPALMVAILLGALPGCGGGGSSAPLPAEDLGVLASTVPSTVPVDFTNPLAQPATVTQVGFSGPFQIDPNDLPAAVGANAVVPLGVVFVPDGTDTITGTVTVRFEGATASRQVTRRFQATGESVSFSIDPADVDFGVVDPGASADRVVTLQNQSSLSPVTITDLNVPNEAFGIVTSLPVTIDPLTSVEVTLRFSPSYGGTYEGTVVLGPLDEGAGIHVPVLGVSPGGGSEVIIDFGTVGFNGDDRTDVLSFDVPSDAVAFMIEAKGAGNQTLGLGSLESPSLVFENTQSTGPYIWSPNVEVYTAQVPNTDRPELQIEPGTWTFQIEAIRRTFQIGVRVIIERRPAGAAENGVLPLNVWLARGITPTAASAAEDARLQAILSRIRIILAEQDIELGDIDYYDVASSNFDFVLESEIDEALESTAAAVETRLNLFFVGQVIGGSVVGVAGMVGGPDCNGTGTSGVLCIYEGYSVSTVAQVATHEIGHYLGLEHTTEDDGSHDDILDTPECPGPECVGPGGGNLMYWQALGGQTITDGQALVIRGHPMMFPGPPGDPPPALVIDGVAPLLAAPDDFWRLGPGWCGTCAR